MQNWLIFVVRYVHNGFVKNANSTERNVRFCLSLFSLCSDNRSLRFCALSSVGALFILQIFGRFFL